MADSAIMADSSWFQTVLDFLVGRSPYSAEQQAFWMAVQGSMAVRQGPNSDLRMHWFHALTLSVIVGFGGGWLGFVWMGLPSSMLSNDLNAAGCLLAFVLVNYVPLGFSLLNLLPLRVLTVSFAQLFRAMGLIKFVNVCFETFKDTPSAYYPIPVFGPILYGTVSRANVSVVCMFWECKILRYLILSRLANHSRTHSLPAFGKHGWVRPERFGGARSERNAVAVSKWYILRIFLPFLCP